MVGYYNVNSIRNKFGDINLLLNGKVDVLTIAETKLDCSFPVTKFCMKGYKKPYRRDEAGNSGGLLVYVNSSIPSRELTNFDFPSDVQIIPVEVNLRKVKWLVISIYRPQKTKLEYFLHYLSEILHFYSSFYDNVLINGDFNSEVTEPKMSEFIDENSLYSHHSLKTCWKSENGSSIDLILSNRKFSLQLTGAAELGVSDFHLYVYTMLKTTFSKLPPKRFVYRSYKKFDDKAFLSDLENSLGDLVNADYEFFDKVFSAVLDRHAPLKTKVLRGNNQPHVSKHLRKEIMKRSRLKNAAVRSKKPEDWAAYKRQRNLVVSINRKAKKEFFSSIGTDSSTKSFWKACKPFFSSKGAAIEERILLVEKDLIVDSDSEIATTFNKYFAAITEGINIPQWKENPSENCGKDVDSAIKAFDDHPSILSIKNKFDLNSCFEFEEPSKHEIFSEILKLDRKKKVSGTIPIKVLQLAARESPFVVEKLSDCFNHALRFGKFPEKLSLADVIPVHKKDSTTDKENYRPISLLPTVSKVFEKLLSKQLIKFFENKLSKFLCGFRKCHSTQHALANLLQKWQKTLDNSGIVGAVLMDLSKAFDCLSHDLLIAKLAAYGVGPNSLKFLLTYLNSRKQRVRIGSSVSDWLGVLLGVPQGSIFGPLFFNIFINDLLFFILDADVCNFADDNTLSIGGMSIQNVLLRLQQDLNVALKWFQNNCLVANPSKFQVLFLGVKEYKDIFLQILGRKVYASAEAKLLGVTLDIKLSFLPHIRIICNMANRMIKALQRIRSYLTLDQAKILCNSFILSLFKYCPIIWMFCGKTGNKLIETAHRRALRAVLNNFHLSYEEMLERLDQCTIHQQNLRVLMTEVYKTYNSLNPEFMSTFLPLKPCQYNFRCGSLMSVSRARLNVGINSLSFRAALGWNHLPKAVKESSSLASFKNAVKNRALYCKCSICSDW